MTGLCLDGERIRRLCREQHVSLRSLALALATSGTQVERMLEGRANIESLTLGDLRRLGETLGVEPTSLLVGIVPTTQATADDLVVEALLAYVDRTLSRTEIAHVLQWDLRRARRAVIDLEARLAPSGLQLRRVGSASVGLKAREELLTDDQRQRSKQSRLVGSGLTSRNAKALLRVATREHQVQRPATGARGSNALANLFNLGLVQEDASRNFVLHPDVGYSLGLADEPVPSDAQSAPTSRTERSLRNITPATHARRERLIEHIRERAPDDVAVIDLPARVNTPLSTVYHDLRALRAQGLVVTSTRGRVKAMPPTG